MLFFLFVNLSVFLSVFSNNYWIGLLLGLAMRSDLVLVVLNLESRLDFSCLLNIVPLSWFDCGDCNLVLWSLIYNPVELLRGMDCFIAGISCCRSVNRELLFDAQDYGATNRASSGCGYGFNLFGARAWEAYWE